MEIEKEITNKYYQLQYIVFLFSNGLTNTTESFFLIKPAGISQF